MHWDWVWVSVRRHTFLQDLSAPRSSLTPSTKTTRQVSDDPAVLTRTYLSPAHRQAAQLVRLCWMWLAGCCVRHHAWLLNPLTPLCHSISALTA